VVMRYLNDGADAATALTRMDTRFASLPGFAGVHIYRDAVDTLAAA